MRPLIVLLFLFTEILASSVPAIRHGIKPKGPKHVRTSGSRRHPQHRHCRGAIVPKLFIISMYSDEAESWYGDENLSLLARNTTVPGFSPLFPQAHCSPSGEVCQMTTGEGEINAAASVTALWTSGCFNLTSTYFLIAGVAGINPHLATTGSVTFSKYAVQFDLQYEFAESQVPSNDSSGWFPQNGDYPDEDDPVDYPGEIYGTEAFELNDKLKKRAVQLAGLAVLNDTKAAQAYRSTYGYAPADQPPSVVECDTGTSNNYFSGSVLGDAFSNYTKLLTNGSGEYCAAQQEDNATLEALLRGDLARKLDFSRIIVMRTASDFDRAPPGETEVFHLLYAQQEGYGLALRNVYLAGIEIVKDVLTCWNSTYASGLKPDNYVGDLFNSLNSKIAPDIGTSAIYIT